MLEEKEAVLFDLDGTLVDSMWMWGEIDREFLAERQLEVPKDLQQKIEGMSFTETAVYFKETFGLSESIEELKRIWNGMAMDKYQNEVPLKPGAEHFLNMLKERGIKTGIATSNSIELVQAVMSAHHMDRWIDVVVTSCEVNKGKPAPDVYLRAAGLLEVDPKDCLVFEDIPMGILAGKNAQMQVCAVEDRYSEFQREEKRELADYYIRTYEDIFERTYEVLKNE